MKFFLMLLPVFIVALGCCSEKWQRPYYIHLYQQGSGEKDIAYLLTFPDAKNISEFVIIDGQLQHQMATDVIVKGDIEFRYADRTFVFKNGVLIIDGKNVEWDRIIVYQDGSYEQGSIMPCK